MITVYFAHPHLKRSRAAVRLYEAAETAAGVRTRLLYEEYPDFSIDVDAERGLIASSEALVFCFPVIWYAAPAMFQQWVEAVFGWSPAGGSRVSLEGRPVLWTGILGADYDATPHERRGELIDVLSAPLRLLVRSCGGRWQAPVAIFTDTPAEADAGLERFAGALRDLGLERDMELGHV